MKRRKFLVAMLPLLMLSADAVAGFYKCTVHGGVVYQEKPCPKGTGGEVELAPITSMSGTTLSPDGRAPAAPKSRPPAQARKQEKAGNPLQKSTAAKPSTTMKVVNYEAGDIWKTDSTGYDAAVVESNRTGAPIFVYFYADWCHVCKKFSAEILPDTAVRARLRHFIKVKVNPEHGDAENAIYRDHGGRGYPTITVQNPDEKARVMRLYAEPEAWVDALDKMLVAKR